MVVGGSVPQRLWPVQFLITGYCIKIKIRYAHKGHQLSGGLMTAGIKPAELPGGAGMLSQDAASTCRSSQ